MSDRILRCHDDIEQFISTLDTGDLIFFAKGMFDSLISFTIRATCNSKWTHVGMIVKNNDKVLFWESVNTHSEVSGFTDMRTNERASGKGARLIDFLTYINLGYGCLKVNGNPSCVFAVLRLKRSSRGNETLKSEIKDYVIHQSSHTKINYPKTVVPLAKAWFDGPESCLVCCGFFSTYDVEQMYLTTSSTEIPKTHTHYKKDADGLVVKTENPVTEEAFCSQLVIMTLEHTSRFKSFIECGEWTVEDLANGHNINEWFESPEMGYQDSIEIRTLFCKT